MLTTLFPQSHTRYVSLPVLGGILEDLCAWLEARGYPPNAIGRRVKAAPFLDECLRRRQIQSLSGCSAAQLRNCFPREKRDMQTIFVMVKCELGRAYEVADEAVSVEQVSEVYSTSGQYDLLMKCYLDEMTDIGHFVTSKIQTLAGVKDTFTLITFKAFS